jgi:O-methyltransferase
MTFPPIRKTLLIITATVGVVVVYGAYRVTKLPPMTTAPPTQSPRQLLSGSEKTAEERYLELMKKYLVRYDFGPTYHPVNMQSSAARRFAGRLLASRGLILARVNPESAEARETGADWPETAETMIGLKRLDNLQQAITDVLKQKVPGDLIECGAWRGGATIFMRAVLQTYGDNERNVWVADSFQGLPKPDEQKFPDDKGINLNESPELAVSIEQVKANFRRYGVLDDRVKFLAGWFKDTLPEAPIEKLSVLRVDGDLYESTWEALEALYPKLSVGGYCIVDDYGAFKACKKAVEDFRSRNNITAELKKIDWTGVYWRREK